MAVTSQNRPIAIVDKANGYLAKFNGPAHAGDTVSFLDMTQGNPKEWYVQFSDDKIFDQPPPQLGYYEVGPGKPLPPLTIMASTPRGSYPFAVFCKTTGGFATERSMPIIIVD
jgi:hypothetical protein